MFICWKIAELMDLTRSGSSWSSSLNPHYVMLWNKTNIDSTEPGCTTSQKMMCILISNSLQCMSPARGEKKVAYKIRHLNPHLYAYIICIDKYILYCQILFFDQNRKCKTIIRNLLVHYDRITVGNILNKRRCKKIWQKRTR